MSTLFIAALLILCTIGLPMLFVFNSKRNKKKQSQKKLDFFLRSGAKNDLFISKREILEDKIIGVDETNKMLLLYELKNEDNVILINMLKVRTCVLYKNYDNMNMGNEKKVRMEQHLASIKIVLGFKNSSDEPVSISFYDNKVNNIYEMANLETKAKKWENILFKMMSNKFQTTV